MFNTYITASVATPAELAAQDPKLRAGLVGVRPIDPQPFSVTDIPAHGSTQRWCGSPVAPVLSDLGWQEHPGQHVRAALAGLRGWGFPCCCSSRSPTSIFSHFSSFPYQGPPPCVPQEGPGLLCPQATPLSTPTFPSSTPQSPPHPALPPPGSGAPGATGRT